MIHNEKAERNAAMAAMAREGATQCEIARAFGLSQSRVQKILYRQGVRFVRGARPLLFNSQRDRLDYTKIREILGADAARQFFGVRPAARFMEGAR